MSTPEFFLPGERVAMVVDSWGDYEEVVGRLERRDDGLWLVEEGPDDSDHLGEYGPLTYAHLRPAPPVCPPEPERERGPLAGLWLSGLEQQLEQERVLLHRLLSRS